MKTKTQFKDAAGNMAKIEIEIKNGRLSMSGEYCGLLGQCLDSIKPTTNEQKRLIEIWEQWHLNDMKAGTPAQMDIAKGMQYDEALKALEAASLLYDKHPETGEPYKYGSAWLTRELPENIEEEIEELIEAIEEAESERKKENLTDLEDSELVALIEEETEYSDSEAELIAAAVHLFDLSGDDLKDVEIDGNRITVQGEEYLAGTDSEMDEAWNEELDNYLEQCVYPEIKDHNLLRYFDDEAWKRDARYDGRGHSLNQYDGGEESHTINGTEYFFYRQ